MRGQVWVAQITTGGGAPDDAVVWHREIDVLHADGVVAVGALR